MAYTSRKSSFSAPGDRPGLPRLAAVCGTNECPARAADPNDVTVDDAQSVQAGFGVRFLRMPLGESGRNKYQENQERHFQLHRESLLTCLDVLTVTWLAVEQ
jgi:hypothetical protein